MNTGDHIKFLEIAHILEKCNIISCNYIGSPFKYKQKTINRKKLGTQAVHTST